MSAEDKIQNAENMVQDTKESFLQKLKEDGIVNPQGLTVRLKQCYPD